MADLILLADDGTAAPYLAHLALETARAAAPELTRPSLWRRPDRRGDAQALATDAWDHLSARHPDLEIRDVATNDLRAALTAARSEGAVILPPGVVLAASARLDDIRALDAEALLSDGNDRTPAPGLLRIGDRVSRTGLIDVRGLPDEVRAPLEAVNAQLREEFDNGLFWSLRYQTNPDLGSGVGSRGVYAELKRLALRRAGAEHAASVLDVGCGDLHVLAPLAIREYLGLDLTEAALTEARRRRPDWRFEATRLDPDRHGGREIVICLADLITAAGARLIVSGFDRPPGDSHMVGFHGPLSDALRASGVFDRVTEIARYRATALLVADRPQCRLPPVEPIDMLDLGDLLLARLDRLERSIGA